MQGEVAAGPYLPSSQFPWVNTQDVGEGTARWPHELVAPRPSHEPPEQMRWVLPPPLETTPDGPGGAILLPDFRGPASVPR